MNTEKPASPVSIMIQALLAIPFVIFAEGMTPGYSGDPLRNLPLFLVVAPIMGVAMIVYEQVRWRRKQRRRAQ